MRDILVKIGLSTTGIVVGVFLSLYGMYSWYEAQDNIGIYMADRIPFLTIQFYSIQAISIALIVLGTILLIKYLMNMKWRQRTIGWVLAIIFGDKRNIKYGILGGIAYFFIYALISGMLVIRPWINYSEILGIESFTVFFTGCCGGFGAIPKITLYIVPSYGVGLLLIPLNLLLSIILPMLVGVNIAVTYHSLKISRGSAPNLLGKIGLVTGIFTGCPTCAGIFISNLTGVLGGGLLATALVLYQIVFIVLTIPILIFTPIITGYMLSKNIYCKIDASGRSGNF